MNSFRKKEIERIATDFRNLLGINSVGVSNIFDVCNSKYYLIRYPLGGDGVLGAAIYKSGDFIVFSNSSQVLSREIFTVAHELGHIQLGHVGSHKQVIKDTDVLEKTNEEAEADYFAACFLMPKDKVDKFVDFQLQNHEKNTWTMVDVAAVMSEFNVSFETAINRLVALGIISQSQRDSLVLQKAEQKVSNLLRAIGEAPDLCFAQNHKSIPWDFLRWTCSNYSKGLIPKESLEKAIEYLDNVSIDDLGVVPPKHDQDFDLDAFLEENE